MPEAPEVSFVVNAFNTERFIGDCLRSIFALVDAPPFEVIVMDDCSTDGTGQVVRAFDDPRLIHLRNERNLNAAASINRAMAETRGRYVARIDSDDLYRPHFLQRTLPVFEAHAEVGMIYGDVAYIDEHGALNGGTAMVGSRRQGRPCIARELKPLLIDNYIPAASIIARREAWQAALPIPGGRNFCDWYCSLQMARKWDFAFVDDLLADYRLHPGNMHKEMVRQKYGETITFLNLEEIFAAENFGAEHEAFRAEAFSTHYALMGQKYFGFGMMADARRCIIEAWRHQPRWLTQRPELARWALASFLPPTLYQRLKRLVAR